MTGVSDFRLFLTDLAAGAALAVIVGVAVSTAFGGPALIAACAGGIVFVRVYPSLRRLHKGTKFPVRSLDAGDVEHVPGMDELAARIGAGPVPAAGPMPTVREMQQAIEQRLGVAGRGSEVAAAASAPVAERPDEEADAAPVAPARLRSAPY